jgi:hypothetical protein
LVVLQNVILNADKPVLQSAKNITMHLRQLAVPVAFVLSSGTLATLPAQAVTPVYAPTKMRLCRPCTMPSIPIALPQRGIVLSFGSFFGNGSTWYVIDLQRAEATHVSARLDRSTSQQSIRKQVTRPLAPEEVSSLTQLVNGIWASKEPLPSIDVTDVAWGIWLLDVDDVRYEFSVGRPDGLAKEIEQSMSRVFMAEKHGQPGVSP